MFALMTAREIYREYVQQLGQLYPANEAMIITDWVFDSVAGLQRAALIKEPRDIVSPETRERLNNCLGALLRHEPVQYVLGEAWFFKMKFIVNEQVLIPRPETEELVQLVIDYCSASTGGYQKPGGTKKSSRDIIPGAKTQSFSILDIGTGSGCIAIALKKKLTDIIMYAIDISPGALSVAKENAVNQQADIKFLQLDFLDENTWNGLPPFDVIISNPPYIPLNEKDGLARHVTAFEPHTALFVPDDKPLIFYEKIASFGKKHLGANGKIYVEIHENFAAPASKLFENYFKVEIKQDLFGKERMLVAGY